MTDTAAIAHTFQRQITNGVLMSLGAHNFVHGNITATEDSTPLPSLAFNARILPMTKSGARGSAPRTMRVVVSLNGADLYDVHVSYRQRGDRYGLKPRVVHHEATDVYADELPRLLLALDYDGATVLNPRHYAA